MYLEGQNAADVGEKNKKKIQQLFSRNSLV